MEHMRRTSSALTSASWGSTVAGSSTSFTSTMAVLTTTASSTTHIAKDDSHAR
jgi:hypothetical protein